MKKRFLKIALLPALLLGALAFLPAGEAKAHDVLVHRRHHHHYHHRQPPHCYPVPHHRHHRAYRAYPVPVYAPVPLPYRAPAIPFYGRPGISIGFGYGF